jgi:ABC-type transport system substrate-binding protein
VGAGGERDATKSIADVTTQVLVQHQYDTASGGLGLSDEADGIYSQLIGAFSSKSPRYGYGTPELDAAIDLFRTADTLDKRKEAAKQVAQILVDQVPVLFIANFNQAVVVSPKLHGVERNAQQNAIFDKAWLAK